MKTKIILTNRIKLISLFQTLFSRQKTNNLEHGNLKIFAWTNLLMLCDKSFWISKKMKLNKLSNFQGNH
jgi:hypothetical protein